MEEKRMTLFDILLPYQRSFVLAQKKKKLFLSGRQLGKSTTLAWYAVYKALSSTIGDSLSLCISTGARASSEFLKRVVQMAEAVHVLCPQITYTASSDKIQFSTGARVISLPSGNPSALRGFSVKGGTVIIDEIGYIERPEEVWSAIIPTLTRDPDSELVVASTATGCGTFFYKLYEDALQDESWYVQTTTIEDAVKQGLQVDLEQLKKTIKDPDIWDREYMCRFAAEYSSLIDISLLDFIDAPEQLDSQPHWLGFDVGSSSDKSALVDLVELGDGTLFVREATMMHKASYEHQLQILKEKHEKLHYKAGFVDANGIGSMVAETAQKQVSSLIRGFTWTGSNKTPAYERLRASIFDHKLKFSAHLKPLVVQDFQNVHRVVNEAGTVKYEAGRDANGHSDFTSALVLALEAHAQKPTQMQMPKADAIRSVFGPMPYGGSRLFR